MEIANWFSLLSLLVSIAAVILTLRFNKHQQEVNKSQKELNDVLLRKEQNDIEVSKKADVSASFVTYGTNKHRLKVFNKGKSPAHNVRIEFPEGTGSVELSRINDTFPMEVLESGQSVDVIAIVFMGRGMGKIPVRVNWSDASQEVNEKVLYLTI